VANSDLWKVSSVERLPLEQRPDPAFRRIYPIHDGAFAVDDLGNAKSFPGAKAAIQSWDREGHIVASKGLRHDIYRTTVQTSGNAIAFMSRECELHVYDTTLNPIIERCLREKTEVSTASEYFGIGTQELKNHMRCVAVSADLSRYLLTIVDQSWCYMANGKALWGVKMPLKEGWSEIISSSGEAATSEEINRALKILGLSFPYDPGEVQHQYWQLAKQSHPDLNPNDPTATSKMQQLNHAAELLSGAKMSSPIFQSAERSEFEKILGKSAIEVPGFGSITLSMKMVGGPTSAADWIYTANFSGTENSVYLASYSGCVVKITEDGKPSRVYGLGAIPGRIIDVGDYLYFLTDSRLYVLRQDIVLAIIDVAEQGELIIAECGFGFKQPHRFDWYSREGKLSGSVITKHPLRNVCSAKSGLIVETRQDRAFITGPPCWWDAT